MFCALAAFGHLSRTLYRRQLGIKSFGKEFVRTRFKASSTCIQKRRGTADVEHCKPAVGQTNDGATSELLSHFPSKIRLAFKSKTFLTGGPTAFPTNDSLTQKRSQDNNVVTKQSLGSIRFIKLRGHFGTVFVKPSAVFVLLTFLLFFKAQKKKFGTITFCLTFRGLKLAKKRCLNFGLLIDLKSKD